MVTMNNNLFEKCCFSSEQIFFTFSINYEPFSSHFPRNHTEMFLDIGNRNMNFDITITHLETSESYSFDMVKNNYAPFLQKLSKKY